MKRFIPLALAMLWLVIASHICCVAPSSRHADGLASGPTAAMLSHVDHPDIKGQLSCARVCQEAPTWEQLVAKVRPDFTWSGPDEEADWGGPHMLWIEKDKDGLIIFRLERAFTMETKNRPARWVLVEATGQERDDAYWNNFSNVLLPARIPMGKEAQEGDGCFADNYTKQIASDDKGGAVFEIGWAPEGNCGNGNYTRQVVVYMWKDLGGTWRLLGQGPITSTERAGCNRHQGQSLGTNVSWAGKPLRPALKIDKSCWFSDAGTEDGDPWPDLVQHEDYVLSLDADGKTTPVRHVSVRPYLLAEKDDTFGKIVQRLSVWSICNDTVWRKRLLLLNPALPAGTVAPGTRVELPTYTEIVDLANASITASQPATKRN